MKTFDLTVVVWKEDIGYVSKCPGRGKLRRFIAGTWR